MPILKPEDRIQSLRPGVFFLINRKCQRQGAFRPGAQLKIAL